MKNFAEFYPLPGFVGDWGMSKDILAGKIKF